jgi:transitional endoplasmic reticulum ATPase
MRDMSADSHVTERVISQLLTELDGLEALHNVTVIAATNRPDMLDPALVRAGRFDRHIHIPVPEEKARLEIFKIHLKDKPLAGDVSIEELAKRTEGKTGADIASLTREATMLAIREALGSSEKISSEKVKKSRIEMRHFEQVLAKWKNGKDRQLDKSYV